MSAWLRRPRRHSSALGRRCSEFVTEAAREARPVQDAGAAGDRGAVGPDFSLSGKREEAQGGLSHRGRPPASTPPAVWAPGLSSQGRRPRNGSPGGRRPGGERVLGEAIDPAHRCG